GCAGFIGEPEVIDEDVAEPLDGRRTARRELGEGGDGGERERDGGNGSDLHFRSSGSREGLQSILNRGAQLVDRGGIHFREGQDDLAQSGHTAPLKLLVVALQPFSPVLAM